MHTDANCIFCKIASKEIPARIVEENANVVAFQDLNPMAPTHVLIVPREHIASVSELSETTAHLVADLALMAKKIAHDLKLNEAGYRVVMNTGKNAGQSVFHLHMHLLGGRALGWPPG